MSDLRRVDELLALRAVEGLGPDEARELDQLLTDKPDAEAEALEYAAAVLDEGMNVDLPQMPARLKRRILETAKDSLATSSGEDLDATPMAPVVRIESRTTRRDFHGAWFPWLTAAAAALIAVVGWWPRVVEQPPAEAPVADTAPAAPIGDEAVDEAAIPAPFDVAVVESAPDALVRSWTATEDPAALAVTGEVVWSGSQQAGFMRIAGLAANDPAVEQYQLWIFDREQDERYPVDGGVFDIPVGDAEAIVPIDAKIAVDEPYLFAVTVEKPGGVVVSSRERIAILAQV